MRHTASETRNEMLQPSITSGDIRYRLPVCPSICEPASRARPVLIAVYHDIARSVPSQQERATGGDYLKVSWRNQWRSLDRSHQCLGELLRLAQVHMQLHVVLFARLKRPQHELSV